MKKQKVKFFEPLHCRLDSHPPIFTLKCIGTLTYGMGAYGENGIHGDKVSKTSFDNILGMYTKVMGGRIKKPKCGWQKNVAQNQHF